MGYILYVFMWGPHLNTVKYCKDYCCTHAHDQHILMMKTNTFTCTYPSNQTSESSTLQFDHPLPLRKWFNLEIWVNQRIFSFFLGYNDDFFNFEKKMLKIVNSNFKNPKITFVRTKNSTFVRSLENSKVIWGRSSVLKFCSHGVQS